MNGAKFNALTFETPFMEGESLTSWLTRAALNQGCSPLTFVHYFWREPRLWTHDVDNNLKDKFPHIYYGIATLAKTKESELQYHTLPFPQLQKQNSRYINWSTPLSKRNRFGKYGYPYCPDCMINSKQAYLRIQWRYSWSVYCTIHQRVLQSVCNKCGHPYQPQLLEAETRFLNHCNFCSSKLDISSRDNLNKHDYEVYENQLMINNTLNNGNGIAFGEKKVQVEQWFDYLHFCILIVRAATENPVHMFGKLLHSMQILRTHETLPILKTKLQFNYLASHERSVLLKYAIRLLQVSQYDWEEKCQELSISKNSFNWSKETVIPKAFKEVYAQLPTNKKPRTNLPNQHSSKPQSLKSVLTMWHKIKHQAKLEQNYNNHKSRDK